MIGIFKFCKELFGAFDIGDNTQEIIDTPINQTIEQYNNCSIKTEVSIGSKIYCYDMAYGIDEFTVTYIDNIKHDKLLFLNIDGTKRYNKYNDKLENFSLRGNNGIFNFQGRVDFSDCFDYRDKVTYYTDKQQCVLDNIDRMLDFINKQIENTKNNILHYTEHVEKSRLDIANQKLKIANLKQKWKKPLIEIGTLCYSFPTSWSNDWQLRVAEVYQIIQSDGNEPIINVVEKVTESNNEYYSLTLNNGNLQYKISEYDPYNSRKDRTYYIDKNECLYNKALLDLTKKTEYIKEDQDVISKEEKILKNLQKEKINLVELKRKQNERN